MTKRRPLQAALLLSSVAVMSCGYAAAQDAAKNPWMAEVAKAAADGRCDEAKTIALRNGSLDVAERVLKLCTPSKAAAPVLQSAQVPTKPAPPVVPIPQSPAPPKAPAPPSVVAVTPTISPAITTQPVTPKVATPTATVTSSSTETAAAPTEPAPATSVPVTLSAVIPAGTPVLIELTEALSSSKSKSGDHFGFKLAEPIMVGGNVVVPAGVTGQGDVIDAKPANLGGRPGRLVLAARYLDNAGLRLTLQSLKLGGSGADHSSAVFVASLAVGLVGALVTGGGLEYPVGTTATAKIALDVTVQIGGAPPITSAASTDLSPLP